MNGKRAVAKEDAGGVYTGGILTVATIGDGSCGKISPKLSRKMHFASISMTITTFFITTEHWLIIASEFSQTE